METSVNGALNIKISSTIPFPKCEGEIVSLLYPTNKLPSVVLLTDSDKVFVVVFYKTLFE